MLIVKHRVNTIKEIKSLNKDLGAEIDIRSSKNKLILHHDPFKKGENLERWIQSFDHKFLILNVKEEGLEKKVLRLMKQNNIKNFFFLDQSIPFLIKTIKSKEYRCAIRLSEYESIETIKKMPVQIKWIWLDCFTKYDMNKSSIKYLLESGKNICVVSPELQGRTSKEEIFLAINKFKRYKFVPNAVCTKYPKLWSESFKL
jgi:hypothetical protein|tara:strand:- start:421 stop:1023 length:603 start_codon:yes stop_codon:yes gene_type:complete